eukprot:TRINITY_DN4189_c0_g1_i1.p1 TRINITY_DN4189_c0_g1~~TRINITY_DN4189_c0_g1_i1.p1  ORF type:complete len:267 (+),score=25.62 TRINITY_DN4189_c0_g1_i1:89-889(+)
MGFLRTTAEPATGRGQHQSTSTFSPPTMDFDFEAEISAKDEVRKASLAAEGKTSAEGALDRGFKTVCRHWLKNLCMKGDTCEYLHQYDPNRMPECFSWLRYGKCTDANCVFKHVSASERPECQRYRLGFCKLGPLCRRRHDRLPKEKIPDLIPDFMLDAVLVNARLIPRAEDVQLSESRSRSLGLFLRDAAFVSSEQGAIPGLPPPLHGKCRFFVIRSMNDRNIQISACKEFGLPVSPSVKDSCHGCIFGHGAAMGNNTNRLFAVG